MLSDKYLLAGFRTYPDPQDVQASLVPGASDRPIIALICFNYVVYNIEDFTVLFRMIGPSRNIMPFQI
jgi:hypothetical protein